MPTTETQKFMGRNQMLERLTAQMGDNETAARDVLIKRGQMTSEGKWTEAGAKRNAMTAQERALDRAKTRTGRDTTEFKYSPETNRATLRKKYL